MDDGNGRKETACQNAHPHFRSHVCVLLLVVYHPPRGVHTQQTHMEAHFAFTSALGEMPPAAAETLSLLLVITSSSNSAYTGKTGVTLSHDLWVRPSKKTKWQGNAQTNILRTQCMRTLSHKGEGRQVIDALMQIERFVWMRTCSKRG